MIIYATKQTIDRYQIKMPEEFENPLAVFSRLTDRRIISTMNRFQTYTLEDGYRLYDFLEDGILRTKKLNKRINKEMIVSDKIAGKTVYFYPKERFAELLKERFR